ncbi:MAG: hypothetical protein H7Y31_14790, partial [Chitinophagaceae bacterium]|nr:hypothetical protein [Chitinophagaceae bacterium]
MQGHDFEKKVQQQMGGLQLPPSDAVWSNVENSIRKDKRRRRIIILLPILLLLGTGSAWILLKQRAAVNTTNLTSTSTSASNSTNDSNNKSSNNRSNDKQSTVISDRTSDISSTKPAESDSRNQRDLTSSKEKVTKSSESIEGVSTREEDKPVAIATSKQKQISIASNPTSANRKPLARSGKAKKDLPTPVDYSKVAASDKNQVAEETVTDIEAAEEKIVSPVQPATIPESTITKVIDTVVAKEEQNIVAVPSSAKKPANADKSKWQFGINAGTGVSRMADAGIFKAFKTALVMDAGTVVGNWNPPVN